MHGIFLGRVNVLFAAAPQASGVKEVKEAAARLMKLQVWPGGGGGDRLAKLEDTEATMIRSITLRRC